jgi:hypothetical protein
MSFTFNSGKQFQVAEEGNHQAVLAAFIDVGKSEGEFGEKDQVIAVWVLDVNDEESGEPLIAVQYLTKSVHEKANLTKVVKALTGSFPSLAFKFDDLMALLGRGATLALTHVEKEGRVRSKIVLVSKPDAKAETVAVPEGWEPPAGLTKGALGVYTSALLAAQNDEKTAEDVI